jgi:hypothetical protein
MKDKKETNRERSAYTPPGRSMGLKNKNLQKIIVFDAEFLHQAVQSRSFNSKNASRIDTYTAHLSQDLSDAFGGHLVEKLVQRQCRIDRNGQVLVLFFKGRKRNIAQRKDSISGQDDSPFNGIF